MLSVLFVITMSAGCGAKDAEDTKPIEPAVAAAAISDEAVTGIVADLEKQLEAIIPSSQTYQALIEKIDFVSKLLASYNDGLAGELATVKTKVETAKTDYEEALKESAAESQAQSAQPNQTSANPKGHGFKEATYTGEDGWKIVVHSDIAYSIKPGTRIDGGAQDTAQYWYDKAMSASNDADELKAIEKFFRYRTLGSFDSNIVSGYFVLQYIKSKQG
jgi:hypothetical protein